MQALIDTVSRWTFRLSPWLLALAYFFFSRQTRRIGELQQELARNKMGEKLNDLERKAATSQKDFAAASKRYTDLRRQHPDLFGR